MRQAFVAIGLCALVQLAAMPAAAQSLANGGFEKGLNGWMISAAPDPAVFQVAGGKDAHSGRSAGLLELREENAAKYNNYAYFGRRDLPTAAGYYRFTFAMRTELSKGSVGPIIAGQKPLEQNILSLRPGVNGVPGVSGSTPWTEYAVVYRLPIPVEVTILQLQMSDALGRVWVDDVNIEKLDDATGDRLMHEQPADGNAIAHGAEYLGEPSRNISAFQRIFYTDRSTGRQLLVINSCTSAGGGAAIFVDYENDTSDVVTLPVGSGGWDLVELSPGKLLVESLDPLFLVPVDVAKRKVLVNEIIPVPVNQYAWRFSKGPDGWIYFGSYPTAHAYRYSPRSGTIEDLGRMGPEGNEYVRYVAATGDGWLLSSVMTEKSGIAIYNIANKTQSFLDLNESPKLTAVDGIVYTTIKGELQQFDSKTQAFVPVRLPAAQGVQWRDINDTSTAKRMVLLGSDGATYIIEAGASEARKIWDLPLRGGRIVGLDDKGRVVGVRGQDYFVAEPLAQTVEWKQITQHAPAIGIHFLRADPRGGVTGGPALGQTLFRFDPGRKLEENTPQVVDSNGEVYDGRWIDGEFYFVSYSGGQLAAWNPDQPWDQWDGTNPRVVAQYNTPEHHELIRPQGGLAIGPGGRLYAGWSATYGKRHGGLSEYDIASGTSRVWKSDLFSPEITIGSVAADDKYVYFISSNFFNGLTAAQKPIEFIVFDPATESVVYRQPLPFNEGTPKLVHVPHTNRIWIGHQNGVQRFDRDAMRLEDVIAWPAPIKSPTSVDSADAADGRAWFGVGLNIVQLDDGKSPEVKTLFGTAAGVQSLASNGKELFYTQGTRLWRVPVK